MADEETPLALNASPAVAADVHVVAELEHRLLENSNIEGIALRYGFFYGPGTWFNHDGDVARQIRRQQFPINEALVLGDDATALRPRRYPEGCRCAPENP